MRTLSKLLTIVVIGSFAQTVSALTVFACEPEYGAIAKAIAPDAQIFTATTHQQDPHHVQARPSLINRYRRSDVGICAGAELEIGWLPMLQLRGNNPKLRDGQRSMIYAADVVELLDKRESVTRADGDVHAAGNPHMHLSPSRVILIARHIGQVFAEIEPENRTTFLTNVAKFESDLNTWIDANQSRIDAFNGSKFIGYHTSFRYLFDFIGAEQVGDLEPVPGSAPTPGHLASLIDLVETHKPLAIVYTPYQDGRGATWLSDRTNTPSVELSYTVQEEQTITELYESILSTLEHITNGTH